MMPHRRQFLRLCGTVLLASMATTLSITGCSDAPTGSYLPVGSKVVALGDSLTYGYGTSLESAYPQMLAELTGWQVVNAGTNGDTSADVLARTDAIVAQKPALVLLGVGGNDVLRRLPPASTTANIRASIGKFKAADIPVLLIAEPHFSTSALFGKVSDNPIYQEIADNENVPLYRKGWAQVLSDETLKSDQIHANAAGYRHFAEGLHQYLQEEGWAR